MNEVSQGELGNQEYVEFVVVDTAVAYNCQNTQPPCIDIRGWIFDDNSGYHGAAGIAAGAVRFSFDPLWQCVPLGSIIVVYNDADPNPLLPPVDVSMNDGNCSIVAPISNTSLFESNSTTPGAVACSYPAAGWTPGGNWSNTLLANGGDCARIVDLGGCEVFSVCWGTDNQNNLIYFAGGATAANSATNTVYYFNDSDPSNQANWSIGCADVPACGIENQTPGAPNNALNAAFIAQFNNNCSPIPPLSSSASVDNSASCLCNGQATASGLGSIPGYTYEWFDSGFLPIGQTTATATNLCGGTYNVVVTSSIGCTDTSQVTVNTSGSINVTVNADTICAGGTASLTATPDVGGGSFLWSPNFQTTQSITVSPLSTTSYMVYYQVGSCIDSAQTSVLVYPLPVINAELDQTVCNGEAITLSGNGAIAYVWDNGVTNGVSFVPTVGTSNYTVTGTDANGCVNTDQVNVIVNPLPVINAGIDQTICDGTLVTLTGSGATSYVWDNGVTNGTSFVPALGTTEYTVTGLDANGCSASDAIVVTVVQNPLANASYSPSGGIAPLQVEFTNLGADATNYIWDFGNGQFTSTALPTNVFTTYAAGTYFITLTATNGICEAIWTDQITVLSGQPSNLIVPNVFTPNNDLDNDFFFLKAENIVSLEGSILNRWGELMVQFNHVDFFWDGTVAGSEASEGTYFIMYKAVGTDQVEYKGHTFFQLQR